MFDDDMFSDSSSCSSLFNDSSLFTNINPGSGLPMMSRGIGGWDVAGNPWGFDDSSFESSSSSSLFDWE